jgi:hypothetical protein
MHRLIILKHVAESKCKIEVASRYSSFRYFAFCSLNCELEERRLIINLPPL